MARAPRTRDSTPPPAPVDTPNCVRGASTAFTILIVGRLAAGLVGALASVLILPWLVLVSVVAYTVAGRRIGAAARPDLHGLIAALGAWALFLPLGLVAVFGGAPVSIGFLAVDLAVAAVVGSISGRQAGKARDRDAPDAPYRRR